MANTVTPNQPTASLNAALLLEPVPEADIEGRSLRKPDTLPPVVRLLNAFLFGHGHLSFALSLGLPTVSCVWLLVASGYDAIECAYKPLETFMVMALPLLLVAEDIANAFFGRSYTHTAIGHYLNELDEPVRQQAKRRLQMVGWASITFEVLFGTFSIVWSLQSFSPFDVPRTCDLTPRWWDSSYAATMVHVVTIPIGLRAIYLAELWLWLCWAFALRAHQFVEHEVTEESVVSLEASHGLLSLLEYGKDCSTSWRINHRVRLLTSTGIAAIYVAQAVAQGDLGEREPEVGDALIGGLFFLLVLVMAAAPAAATDQFLSDAQLKLARLAHANASEVALQQHATQLMQRATCLQGRIGMEFLGVSMTTGRAIKVGSVFGTIIVFIIRLG